MAGKEGATVHAPRRRLDRGQAVLLADLAPDFNEIARADVSSVVPVDDEDAVGGLGVVVALGILDEIAAEAPLAGGNERDDTARRAREAGAEARVSGSLDVPHRGARA